jgi:hypothetical protein
VSRRSASLVAVVTAAVLVAALGSAVAGPWEMEERDLSWLTDWLEGEVAEPIDLGTLPEFEFEPATPSGPGPDLSWMRWVGIGVAVAAGVAALVWLIRRYRRTRLPEPVASQRMEGAAGPAEMPEIPVLQKGVREARRMLEEGSDPDDAIISAWMALEAAAADAGVRRRPSQTPTEFAVAILERTAADSTATQRLLALYRRARFSRHRSTRDDVTEAVRCLGVLAENWDTVSAGENR